MVVAAGLETGCMETVDGGAIGGTERDVHAWGGRALGEIERRLAARTEARARFVAGTELMAERSGRGHIEAHARLDVPHRQSDVIVHGDLLWLEVTLPKVLGADLG